LVEAADLLKSAPVQQQAEPRQHVDVLHDVCFVGEQLLDLGAARGRGAARAERQHRLALHAVADRGARGDAVVAQERAAEPSPQLRAGGSGARGRSPGGGGASRWSRCGAACVSLLSTSRCSCCACCMPALAPPAKPRLWVWGSTRTRGWIAASAAVAGSPWLSTSRISSSGWPACASRLWMQARVRSAPPWHGMITEHCIAPVFGTRRRERKTRPPD